MSVAKKFKPEHTDPVNEKIQRKFDIVFNDEETGMEKKAKASEQTEQDLSIDLDFSVGELGEEETKLSSPEILSGSGDHEDGLDFSLNFDLDAEVERTSSASVNDSPAFNNSEEGFSIDGIDAGEMDFDNATKKTVVLNPEAVEAPEIPELVESSFTGSAEMMSTEEEKANMETTIKDILRPKFDEPVDKTINENFDSVLDLGDASSGGFIVSNVVGDDAFTAKAQADKTLQATIEPTDEFSMSSDDFDIPTRTEFVQPKKTEAQHFSREERSTSIPVQNSSTEDSVRFQATIRALREEREEFLAQIKTLKVESKELEQDNLTLKANLDEAKIEISILRKRHMVELEDMKYRLSLSEEKKAMSEEKARQADARREKLEQKVRIDFNQVKQREKELESKLELLSMDVDSQVQSRDQKILELRRKIDALEFNMENASIKEQKSLDDKRRLEDRLNKIMKTLRHSIKNLEDDIDHAEAENDDQQKE